MKMSCITIHTVECYGTEQCDHQFGRCRVHDSPGALLGDQDELLLVNALALELSDVTDDLTKLGKLQSAVVVLVVVAKQKRGAASRNPAGIS